MFYNFCNKLLSLFALCCSTCTNVIVAVAAVFYNFCNKLLSLFALCCSTCTNVIVAVPCSVLQLL